MSSKTLFSFQGLDADAIFQLLKKISPFDTFQANLLFQLNLHGHAVLSAHRIEQQAETGEK